MKIHYIFIIILLIASCKQNQKGDIIITDSTINKIDSILSEIEESLEKKVKPFKDSLLKNIDLSTIPKIEDQKMRDTFIAYLTAINNRDTIEYECLSSRVPYSRYLDLDKKNIDPIDYSPYTLYMADSLGYIPSYEDTYESLIQLNYCYGNIWGDKNYEFVYLRYLSKMQRDLAILYLIKSYKVGSISSPLGLSIYFKLGLFYFPKDQKLSKVLDLIFEQRLLLE